VIFLEYEISSIQAVN